MKTKEEMLEENRQLRKEFLNRGFGSEIIADTKKHLKELIARNPQELDDVQYNQEWWQWYCNEHKLDVATGKSLRGSSYPIPPNYTLF